MKCLTKSFHLRCVMTLAVSVALLGCNGSADQKLPSIKTVDSKTISVERSVSNFWKQEPRFGANTFNETPPDQVLFDAWADYGGAWIRLSWTKWDSASGGDFLIGDTSNYSGLIAEDLAVLRDVVAHAAAADVKLVLVPLSLPGAVWGQHNNDELDDRLYTDTAYWDQAAAFWTDMAMAFRDDETVVAYNILNEPAPERSAGYESGTREENKAWYSDAAKGTARDLPAFYEHIIKAIRAVDPSTPIMVDGGFYGNPNGFDYFETALSDDNVLYAHHMAKPWAATSVRNVRNGMTLSYPGEMEIWGRKQVWDAARVQQVLQVPVDWAREVGVDPKQVVMSEFGCHRYLDWCAAYMEDVLSAADDDGLHWAVYAFRSDNWGGRDFELGKNPPNPRDHGVTSEEFWKLSDMNRLSEIKRLNGPSFEPVSRRLEAKSDAAKSP